MPGLRSSGRRPSGADVCIEYSGSHAALQAALRGVVYGGTVVAGAWPGAYPAGLDFGAEAHMNRLRIVFSRACSGRIRTTPTGTRTASSTSSGVCWRAALVSEPVVHPVVAFDDLVTEYPKIATEPETNIKLGVRF